MAKKDQLQLVKVAVPIPSHQAFIYAVSEDHLSSVRAGVRVLVPLGPRTHVGLVLGEASPLPGHTKIRKVLQVLDASPLLSPHLIELGNWLSRYYMVPVGEAFRVMFPPAIFSRRAGQKASREGLWPTRKRRMITHTFAGEERELSPRQRQVLDEISAMRLPVALTDAVQQTRSSAQLLQRLSAQGVLRVDEVELYRSPWRDAPGGPPEFRKHQLTTGQRRIFQLIKKELETTEFRSLLIHGITGSGKTEIYLNSIEATLEMGRSALVLVPEIGLTPQISNQFKSWFSDRVAILHSSLSDGERFDEWRRIRAGKARVVIGTRSAVFAPLQNLGAIIVDEEQDSSYKQEETPRYNARDVALKRAQQEGALVILGSATPQLETYHHARQGGRMRYESLRSRVGKRALPTVHIVDMRVEFQKHGGEKLCSDPLADGIRKRLEKQQQILMLLNRRGYASALLCRACGHTESCHNCSVTLTYHRDRSRLTCHYCGYSRSLPRRCPDCNKQYLHYLGMGTEQVEEKLQALFPQARIDRLDRDSTRRKGSLQSILQSFHSGETDILVGTQMVAKGHDFPGVTLVGVLAADQGLRLADFRAAERTFQLLTQVAGRAGRGDHPGEVVIQTYFPNHYSLKYACMQDYERFYEREIRFRRRFRYPPFTALANLVIRGPRENQTKTIAADLARSLVEIRNTLSDARRLRVLGPAPAALFRLKGEYRFQVLLKTTSRKELNQVVVEALEKLPSRHRKRVIIDIDPVNLL